MTTAGYSGTPLAKKLGIKEGFTVCLVNEPKHYATLFDILPEIILVAEPAPKTIDFIHFFCTSIKVFEEQSLYLKTRLKSNGMLWVSWPKGSSSIPTDLSRDVIRSYLLKNGLVDVKVCAVDEDWSGLKFMYRIKDRK